MDFASNKGLILVAGLLLLLLLERLFPMVKRAEDLWRLAKNFSLALMNAGLSALIVIPLAYLASSWSLQWRPESLIIDVLLLDAWIYGWHRLNHVVPFLWRFHEVHHLDETLDASSALRFHFGEVFLSSVARVLVIMMLGVPVQHVIIFELLLALAAMFHHSNLRLPNWIERPLSFVVVTPSIHWVHHHAVRADTDSNYSTVFSIWDVLFGSRSKTVREVGMKIGVEGLQDVTLLRLILRPFIGK